MAVEGQLFSEIQIDGSVKNRRFRHPAVVNPRREIHRDFADIMPQQKQRVQKFIITKTVLAVKVVTRPGRDIGNLHEFSPNA